MIGALWTGISGLAGQQTALDNESHNIANVNTIGYKASRISFADQLYQDKIGKGSKILDAEKLFTQGNLKLTGVAYDMALKGNGFFAVKSEGGSGSSETYFTRAGNFRMGDNGTLQDASGNAVQGWGMSAVDPDNDVMSTNPNVDVFTSDYSELVSSKVISHSNYVETITAKTTDFDKTAASDSETVFTGYGLKTQASKVNDIEELISNYTEKLEDYQTNPEASSSSSSVQKTQIKFQGDEFKKENDQIYVYINGDKITQEFIAVTTTEDMDADGIAPGSSILEQADDNLAASRIATYQALANKISEVTGLVAYTVTDELGNGAVDGTFEASDTFSKVTANPTTGYANTALGMIEIVSMVPGETFTVTEAAEISGSQTYQGNVNATSSATSAIVGTGLGALESARDALSRAVSGNQRDVLTPADLDLDNSSAGDDYSLEILVYDKETDQNVTVGPITLNGMNTIDEIIAGLMTGGAPSADVTLAAEFSKYFDAVNVNGNMVISTNSANYDIEFTTSLTATNKAFSYTTQGQNSTFDTEFKPSPDGSKDYTINISYDEDFPATLSGTNNEIATFGSSLATTTLPFALGTEYSLSIAFDDADNSLTRGGGNQNLDFDFEITTSSGPSVIADLLTDVNTALATVSGGDFTATLTAGALPLVITNNDGETISEIKLTQKLTELPLTSAAIAVPNDVFVTPSDIAGLATGITAGSITDGGQVTASTNSDNELVLNLGVNFENLQVELIETGTNDIIERNADYSGRTGAGAEFIEIVNTINQASSQDSLQLRLDTLGISDSAFGEFSVDSSGLITMKQDGAEFAIGQVAVATFNNTRGLEPYGDNLLAKSTNSGEPIYNVNNDRTSDIQGETLELSTADLSESLVNLMVFQRAFEANAKTITTSDALLNTLINLKR